MQKSTESIKKRDFGSIMRDTISRFGQDLFGVLIISISLITLLGLLGISKGNLIDQWKMFVLRSFGWGSYFIIVCLIIAGILVLARHFRNRMKIDFSRIVMLEIFFFILLGSLSALFDFSIERASQGLDGGIVGWGFARIFTDRIGKPFTIFIFLLTGVLIILLFTNAFRRFYAKADQYFEKIINQQYGQGARIKKYQDGLPHHAIKESFPDAPTTPIFLNTKLPPIDLLLDPASTISDETYIHSKAIQIENTLKEFGVPSKVAGYRIGPTIIQYAIEPEYIEKVNEEGNIVKKKIKISQISGLNKDLALSLSADRLRIEAPIPGYSFVGIEIPNKISSVVRLKPIIKSEEFQKSNSSLTLALGLDVSGNPIVANLERMPHLLIAGTTGSGKSVCITSLITCLVMNNSPEDLKIAILDPKMVELVRFNGLPHLLGKVETKVDRMLAILAWAIKEMEDRYKKLEEMNARDLNTYNMKAGRRGKPRLPKIILVIDELADLMLSETEKTESYLVRLAQMARATGIHLIVATQRPSTDIITGLIKANFPARISFMMASSVDSRVILDTNGAETLMGKGDMLYMDPESTGLTRSQGVMVDDREIEKIIHYWKNHYEQVQDPLEAPWDKFVDEVSNDRDSLLEKAIRLVQKEGSATTSHLQRKLRVGFPRAARLMDELEKMGIVGPQEPGGKPREVYGKEESVD